MSAFATAMALQRKVWELERALAEREAELALVTGDPLHKWRPIATAPKDEAVLLYEPETGARYVSRWTEETYPHWRGYTWAEPSHWYPLPPVPE